MTDAPAIVTQGLRKEYGRTPAVRGLNLSVRRGEIFGLVGPDGAGKTTTIQMLCTLSLPSGGNASVLGMDTVKQADAVRPHIGYMSEHFTLYSTLTVAENLDFFARLRRIPAEEADARKAELLRFSRLTEFQDRLAEQLSGGMQKKLALCCTLIHHPQVIFLDEPTTGVDPVSRQDFWRILTRFLAEGVTVFVSTPYLDEAERFNRVALIHDGEVIACASPQQLKRDLRGELLEIKAEPAHRAVTVISGIAPRSVNIFGNAIHVLVDSADEELPRLKALLDRGGIRLTSIRRIPPSLEDVFVDLMVTRQQEPVSTTGLPRVETQPPVAGRPDGDAISAVDLTRRFGNFTAVDRVSFSVKRGEIFGFLGPNGSGKTTTIRMLCGLLLPTSGTAIVLGNDMSRSADAVRPRIGYMSQRFSLLRDLSVEENIDLYGRLYGLSHAQRKERKTWVLEMAGLRGREKALARSLSGGWKQRLALGCAVIHNPEVLFLDEPTAGVDPLSRRFFWQFILELAQQGTSILVTTHYMDEAEHCNRLALMYQGELIAMGTPLELKTRAVRGEMVEIATSDFSRAIDLLSVQPDYRQPRFFGDRIHMAVNSAAEASPAIKRILEDAGIGVQYISPVAFTLEDVFVSLIEEQEARHPLKGA